MSAVSEPTALNDVLITEQLKDRTSRAPNLTEQNNLLHTLARSLNLPPALMLQTLVDASLPLLGGGSVGVSLLERDDDDSPVFRWAMIAGKLKPYSGGTSPRDQSPCGLTI